jgi:hypothetical protein
MVAKTLTATGYTTAADPMIITVELPSGQYALSCKYSAIKDCVITVVIGEGGNVALARELVGRLEVGGQV